MPFTNRAASTLALLDSSEEAPWPPPATTKMTDTSALMPCTHSTRVLESLAALPYPRLLLLIEPLAWKQQLLG